MGLSHFPVCQVKASRIEIFKELGHVIPGCVGCNYALMLPIIEIVPCLARSLVSDAHPIYNQHSMVGCNM